MEMALKMPRNYVEVTEEEMMYVDGGWSGSTFAKNWNAFANKYAPSGVSVYVKSSWSYWTAVSMVGAKVGAAFSAAAAAVTGPLAVPIGAVAALGGVGAILYLGNKRVFY